MDSVRSLGGIFGPMQVGERHGGRNGNGDAFRQALEQQQQGGDPPPAEPPLPSALQSQVPADRKKDDDGCHVDVFA